MRISDWSSDVCSSDLSPEPTIDLRAPARSFASRSRSSSNRRARSTFIALALFLCCDFSSCWLTTSPVGRWVIRTAESVVLTDWPPGPDERNTSMRRRSEEHTSELQSLMRISSAVFCLKTKTYLTTQKHT